jgi:lipopolysaccharide transport system permease protein
MPFRLEMVWLPILLLVAIAFSLATGLWLATLSVRFRDVSFAVNFFLQALMYLSPVIYPVDIVPPSLRFIYHLNPMTGVIQGYRWAILGIGTAPGVEFLIAIGLVIAGVISGMYVFSRTERTVVDYL